MEKLETIPIELLATPIDSASYTFFDFEELDNILSQYGVLYKRRGEFGRTVKETVNRAVDLAEKTGRFVALPFTPRESGLTVVVDPFTRENTEEFDELCKQAAPIIELSILIPEEPNEETQKAFIKERADIANNLPANRRLAEIKAEHETTKIATQGEWAEMALKSEKSTTRRR